MVAPRRRSIRYSALKPDIASPDGREQGVLGAAISDNILAAGHGGQVAAEADARLLDVARAAGDGDAVALHRRVRLQERFFNHQGGQAHGAVELAEHFGAHHAVVGLAR